MTTYNPNSCYKLILIKAYNESRDTEESYTNLHTHPRDSITNEYNNHKKSTRQKNQKENVQSLPAANCPLASQLQTHAHAHNDFNKIVNIISLSTGFQKNAFAKKSIANMTN